MPVLRYDERGRLWHYCVACKRLHPLPSDTGGWKFDGNMERPTFTPSFKHGWRTSKGERVCHYTLTGGVLTYCADCTHAMAGQVVPLAPIPEGAE